MCVMLLPNLGYLLQIPYAFPPKDSDARTIGQMLDLVQAWQRKSVDYQAYERLLVVNLRLIFTKTSRRTS